MIENVSRRGWCVYTPLPQKTTTPLEIARGMARRWDTKGNERTLDCTPATLLKEAWKDRLDASQRHTA